MRHINAPPLPAARPRWHRPLPKGLRQAQRYGVSAMLIATIAGGGFWLWRTAAFARGYNQALGATLEITADLGLRVADVMVEGRHETQPQMIVSALGVKRGAPLLGVGIETARQRLETLPWVRAASVERRWPQLVYVRIEERTPLALWQVNGKIKLVDRDGVVIDGVDVARFASLPMVVGEGAPKQAPAILEALAKTPDLARHVEAAIWVGNRRWNLRLEHGIDVRLPEDNPEEALARLAELEAKHQLLSRDIVMIDLRLPDRLIVRLSSDAAQRERKPGKST